MTPRTTPAVGNGQSWVRTASWTVCEARRSDEFIQVRASPTMRTARAWTHNGRAATVPRRLSSDDASRLNPKIGRVVRIQTPQPDGTDTYRMTGPGAVGEEDSASGLAWGCSHPGTPSANGIASAPAASPIEARHLERRSPDRQTAGKPVPVRGSADPGGHRNSRGPISSIGFLNPSRLRGRSLSSAATQSRSAAVWTERSLLFGCLCVCQAAGSAVVESRMAGLGSDRTRRRTVRRVKAAGSPGRSGSAILISTRTPTSTRPPSTLSPPPPGSAPGSRCV